MKLRNWLATGLLILAALSPSFAAGRDLAVLVVGRGNDASTAAKERAIIDTLTKERTQRNWNHKLLPIYSYHFDKPAERAYCEERLKIKQGDLIVVGLVELESGVPIDFVFRENDVTSAVAVADKVMDRARAELSARGRLASTTPVASSTPSRTPSPAVSKPTPAQSPSTTSRPSSSPVVTRPSSTPVVTRPSATPSSTPVATHTPTSTRTPVIVRNTPVAVTTAPSSPSMKPAPVYTPPPVVRTHPTPRTTPVKPVVKPVAVNHPPTSGERWGVQIGLFTTLDKARALVTKMKEANPQLEFFVYKGVKDGQPVFRVILGTFGSQADAYAQAKQLQESGMEGFSVKMDASLGTVVK